MTAAMEAPTTTEELARRFSTFQLWLQGDLDAPLKAFGQLREAGPIHYSEEFGGFWVVTRYQDIEAISRQPEVFVSQKALIPWNPTFPEGERAIPLELDGEDHRKWRKALHEAFSPATVNHFTPVIRTAAAEFVEEIAQKGSCDFVAEFSAKLPGEAFLANFGAPREQLKPMLALKDWLVREGLPNATSPDAIINATADIKQFWSDEIDRRRESGADGHDVISSLLRAKIDDAEIPHAQLVNACFINMMASLDTTTAALSLSWARLATRPDLQQAAADPGRRPSLVEELIRHEPVNTTARMVASETTIGGATLKPGDMVLMSWGMTGLDPEIYDNPDEIDLNREVTRKLAFGIGPHRCLGMHLARRIITIAMEEWHARIPTYHITEGQGPFAHYSPIRGLLYLPLSY